MELVSLPQRGKGRATREGVLRARGNVVFLCDADLSMPPHTLDAFMQSAEDVDVVVGSREAPGAQRIGEPWHRHLMGRVFNRLVQILAVPGVHDTQCGFKAFRRAAAEDLFSRQTLTGWGFDVEILYLARKYGYRIAELPIQWYFDADTRVRPGTDTISMLRELVMIRLRDFQGRYSRPRTSSVSEGDRVGR
jgi:dolichyl-phosphate beta-glucosyltransferase